MDQQKKEKLAQNGIDADSALARFLNNEALFMKFLLRFPDDPNYGALQAALEAGDIKGAFAAGHTLKGVAGNLSLNRLHDVVSEQVEALRIENLEEAVRQMPGVTQAYEQVLTALGELK